MKRIIVSALMSLLLAGGLSAQAMYDRVTVEFANEVTVQDKVLEPGQYTIEEHRSSGDSPIVHIFRGDEMVFETSAMTISATDNQIKEDTSVELQRIGEQHFLSKIWIAGKTYGYELPLPEKARNLQQELESVQVSGDYEESQQAMEQSAGDLGQRTESAAGEAERGAESAAGEVERGAESAASTVESGAERAAQETEQAAESVAGATERETESAAGAAERGAERTAQEAEQGAEAVAGATEREAEQSGAAIQREGSEAGNQIGQSAESAAASVESGAESAAGAVERGAESVAREAEQGAEAAAGAVERDSEQADVNQRDDSNLMAQNRNMQQREDVQLLPETASPLPLLALLGFGSLAGGLAARRRRK